jgi:5-methylcytosine-specific restriction endonuclease McrA
MKFQHGMPAMGKVRQPLPEGKRLTGCRWTILRNRFMRHNPLCAKCGKVGEQVHHVIPRAKRPDLTYTWDNLQTLCIDCHVQTHADAEKPHS